MGNVTADRAWDVHPVTEADIEALLKLAPYCSFSACPAQGMSSAASKQQVILLSPFIALSIHSCKFRDGNIYQAGYAVATNCKLSTLLS